MSEVKKPDYSSANYCAPFRMASFGYQIKEVMSQKPRTLLEIGIGSGVVTYVLRNSGIDVVTIDTDNKLKSDIVGSVLELPFEHNAFNGALCCQVLEHLPFNKFTQALRELWRVSRAFVVVSLPDASRHYRIEVKLPKIKFRFARDVQWRPRDHIFEGEHYWEIGKSGYQLPTILGYMREAGFMCIRNYRIWEWPYHRFFLLAKTITPNRHAPI